MIKNLSLSFMSTCLLLFAVGNCFATTVPFTEDFGPDVAKWLNFNSSALLTHNVSGGPDGSSYASGDFNFLNSVFGDQGPVILRGTTSVLGPASGGAFFGDWITDGVKRFHAFVRHDAGVPLSFFTRFADTINFPGATAVEFAPVPSGVWTELAFDINPNSPNFVTFEGQTFATVFDNIGQVQLGVSIPSALAGVNQIVTFDLDQVSISEVPEPASLALAALACFGVLIGAGRRCFDCEATKKFAS